MNANIIKANPVISKLTELLKKHPSSYLTGGGVIDILEGREPKDYDILGFYISSLSNLPEEFIFLYETKTSYTYDLDGNVIQFLKTKVEQFDFKISQSTYKFQSNLLTIDDLSFKNKTLTPVSFEPNRAKECLYRIPHWQRKGYNIHPMTYLSLLNASFKTIIKQS